MVTPDQMWAIVWNCWLSKGPPMSSYQAKIEHFRHFNQNMRRPRSYELSSLVGIGKSRFSSKPITREYLSSFRVVKLIPDHFSGGMASCNVLWLFFMLTATLRGSHGAPKLTDVSLHHISCALDWFRLTCILHSKAFFFKAVALVSLRKQRAW